MTPCPATGVSDEHLIRTYEKEPSHKSNKIARITLVSLCAVPGKSVMPLLSCLRGACLSLSGYSSYSDEVKKSGDFLVDTSFSRC